MKFLLKIYIAYLKWYLKDGYGLYLGIYDVVRLQKKIDRLEGKAGNWW